MNKVFSFLIVFLLAVVQQCVGGQLQVFFDGGFDTNTISSVTCEGIRTNTFSNGSIPIQTVNAGSTFRFIATPKEGYEKPKFTVVQKNAGTNVLSVVAQDEWRGAINYSTTIGYAAASPREFTVVFRPNAPASGTPSVSPSSKTVVYDSTYGVLASATCPGYAFTGWYTEASGGTKTEPTTQVKILANQDLYAHWEPYAYTVEFAGGADGVEGAMPSLRLEYGTTTNLPALGYSRANYDFGCWSNVVTGLTYKDRASISNLTNGHNAVVSLVAVWEAKGYTIRYHRNYEGDVYESQKIAFGESVRMNKGFNRTGYEFLGWSASASSAEPRYTADELVTSSDFAFDENGVFNLYAVWKANSYTVDFDANGGQGLAMAAMTRQVDDGVALTACGFERVGYLFRGWATEKTGAVKFADGATETITSTKDAVVTLYAVWEPISYTLAFAQGGSNVTGEMATVSATYGSAFRLPACAFGKDGYDFVGWTQDGLEEPEIYADGALVSNLTATADATVTFAANWKAQTYDVTLDVNGGVFVTNQSARVVKFAVTVDSPYGAFPEATNPAPKMVFNAWRKPTTAGSGDIVTSADLVPPPSAGVTNLVAEWVRDDPLARAVDAPELEFLSEAGSVGTNWFPLADAQAKGGVCAAATSVKDRVEGRVTMTTTVVGPGRLSFDWMILSHGDAETPWGGEEDWGSMAENLTFGLGAGDSEDFICGIAATTGDRWVMAFGGDDHAPIKDGTLGWTNFVYEVTADPGETNTFFWCYYYSDAGQAWAGTARVDNVVWTPAGATTETATHKVSYAWLKQNFTGYDSASAEELERLAERVSGPRQDKAWPDGTPYYVWQDYVAGTDPAKVDDVLRAFIGLTNQVPYVWCEPPAGSGGAPEDHYRILGKRHLEDPVWTTNAVPSETSGYRFFKVNIVWP